MCRCARNISCFRVSFNYHVNESKLLPRLVGLRYPERSLLEKNAIAYTAAKQLKAFHCVYVACILSAAIFGNLSSDKKVGDSPASCILYQHCGWQKSQQAYTYMFPVVLHIDPHQSLKNCSSRLCATAKSSKIAPPTTAGRANHVK